MQRLDRRHGTKEFDCDKCVSILTIWSRSDQRLCFFFFGSRCLDSCDSLKSWEIPRDLQLNRSDCSRKKLNMATFSVTVASIHQATFAWTRYDVHQD